MSYQASAWAVAQKCESGTEKAILLVLASYIGPDGTCFPGQDTLADQACCSVKSVERALKSFEDKGWISRSVRRRKDGSRTSDLVTFTGLDHPEEHQPDTVSDSEPTRHGVQTNPTLCPNQPDTMSGLSTFEPVRGIAREPVSLLASPSPSPERVAFAEWNALAERLGLPQATKLTPQRQKHLKARLKSDGLDGWRAALAGVERSNHCRGVNDRGWRADIDFVLQPTSFQRLVEGFYGADAPKAVAAWDDARWSAVVALNRDEGWWSADLGPRPGEPGCRVPPHLIERQAA